MKIITIIGARPQIIKAAALSRAIKNHFSSKIKEIIVHTGQHYDANMSGVFFDELGIPQPDYNLNVGSSGHAAQTAEMLKGIEEVIQKEGPDALVVYGDTNSTVAGGLAASKMGVPVVHIEAGLRSYDKRMPEEINRILTDHISTLLFSPTETGRINLEKEGVVSEPSQKAHLNHPKVLVSGDIMYDNSLHFQKLADNKEGQMRELIGNHDPFCLATVHRASNTDDPKLLAQIFEAFLQIIDEQNTQIVLPLHPRTAKALQQIPIDLQGLINKSPGLKMIDPVSFLEMTWLESNSELVLTDSGGVQKEAFFFQKPCVILREHTEWVEIVKAGCGILAHADKTKIVASFKKLMLQSNLEYPSFYGKGDAAKNICETLLIELS